MKKVGIIDCGISNLTSIKNTLSYLDIDADICDSPAMLNHCSHLILPGVGTFSQGMKNLTSSGLAASIIKKVEEGVPLLGICLGMQLLADEGEEFGPSKGLGLIPGKVVKLNVDTNQFRLPHIGWNEVVFSKETPLTKGLPAGEAFYFIHSYAYSAENEFTTGYCEYGGKVIAAVNRNNVYGVQFHPEKSQKAGLNLINNFVALC